MSTRDAILIVLGMHRSGTSFLTDCTEALGFVLPGDRSGPAPDNPKGHFEPRAIVDLNDATLAHEGAVWARVAPVSTMPAPQDMATAITASFGDAPRIVIKDPRMSLMMAGWRPFLESLGRVGVLISLRHPAETAASLARRDAIAPDLAYLIWIGHTLAALAGSEGMARALVLFPQWTEAAPDTLARIARVAGVDLPTRAAQAVEARFQQSAVHGGRHLRAADPAINALADGLFAFLARHAQDGTMPDAADLAPFHAEFTAVSASAAALEGYLATRMRQLQADAAARLADGVSLQQQVAETRDERNRVVLALETQRDAAEAQLMQAQDQLAGMDAQRHQMQHLLEAERRTVLKPLYRNLHRAGGALLRRILPQSAFERLKRALPYPGAIPTSLAYAPLRAPSGRVRDLNDLAPAAPGKPDIFVLSIINWDFRTQRPQHLAAELARAGHRVFYIEMETDPGPGSAREVAPGTHVLRLPGAGLAGVKPYAGRVAARAVRAWVDHFHALCDQIGVTRRAHLIVQHPYWWHFARHLSAQYQITFDCMDEIAGFSNTDQAILALEEDMIARADHMVVSSQYLFDKYSSSRPVTLIRNGADVSHFIRDGDDPALPGFLQGKLREGAIRVGYVGAIAEWFDTDLIESIALENPDFDIHLCGAVSAEPPARLAALPNVTLHGEIAYADVPGFLMAMDVLTIPFQLLPIIKACDPVKFYEYSAMRKPTVSTALPELARAGDLVTIASDASGFAAGIRAAAASAHDPARAGALRRYALDNTWSDRAGVLLDVMEQAATVSVVVLAYGPADLTLACLHSLTGQNESYPALEVIVVDNGPAGAERDRLRARAASDARIRLIENEENLGFAGGNNIGIQAATGDYVLLLNNDTYVPPGAIAAMVRHLERNPDLGIIGPLTNNIGNEARIDVSYADMPAMEIAARDLTTGYRGIWTDMPVAAYFCAMFRRADLARIGDLPTVYGRGMFEDDDHCASFRAFGLDIGLAEDAFVHHHLSATFSAVPSAEKQALFEANRAIFESRWGAWVPHRYRMTRPAPSLPERT
ncbi:MAG: glycosyltransferase [Paracoccus sp. (in: a-proteobacteria)]|nr:glycosyltransferase [Paracoccus sp. (in: a-proteobacteria)]